MINYIGNRLKRELHYVKVTDSDGTEYQPAMMIFRPSLLGRSFWISIDALWKYMEPFGYRVDHRALEADVKEFEGIYDECKAAIQWFRVHYNYILTEEQKQMKAGAEATQECLEFALKIAKDSKIYLCTAFNLARILQMFDIPFVLSAASQLLLWIQSRLDDLKNMPMNPEQEVMHTGGEVSLMINGQKITQELKIGETELAIEQGAN